MSLAYDIPASSAHPSSDRGCLCARDNPVGLTLGGPWSLECPWLPEPLTVRVATRAVDLLEARRLHAAVYRDKGYVEDTNLVDGVLTARVDPWVPYSTYLVARDARGRLVGVCRQILAPRAADLPVFQLDGLDPAVTAQLHRQPASSVVEISALVIAKGAPAGTTTALYAGLWRHSLHRRHSAWVLSIHPGVFRLIVAGLGPMLARFGPDQWFMGSDVTPSVVWTDTAAQTVARHAIGLSDPHQASSLPGLFPPSDVRRTA